MYGGLPNEIVFANLGLQIKKRQENYKLLEKEILETRLEKPSNILLLGHNSFTESTHFAFARIVLALSIATLLGLFMP